ncbi:MAG: riboflavin kinase [Parcubacteria group bacterium]|jgi:riboflavin kinase/FMN adenylyltransferase
MKNQYLKIVGKVIHGQENGRKLGFPTANLNFNGKIDAGVYAGNVEFEGKKYKAAIVYFPEKSLLEAHLLDFSGNLYDKEIEMEIGEKIREIIKFKNKKELIQQIEKDIELIK